MKKIKLAFLTIVLIVVTIAFPAKIAASAFSINAVNNGNGTLTVSVTGNIVGGFSVKAGSVASTATINVIGGTGTATLKTGEGTYTVEVTSLSISDAAYNVLPNETLTQQVKVTLPSTNSGGGGTTYVPPKVNTDPDKRSADNNLAGLSVSQGKLTPDFNSEVTNYRVEAGANL
ncbi:MAG: hypothetical protein RR673_01975, partial [Erysipelotrichaceae bacterium]